MSGSLISKLMSASWIQVPREFTRRIASRAGTCLRQTMIFMALGIRTRNAAKMPFRSILSSVPHPGCHTRSRCLTFPALEQQRGVGSPKTERVGKRILDLGRARLVGNVIQIAPRIGILVIDRGRKNLVAHGQQGQAGL